MATEQSSLFVWPEPSVKNLDDVISYVKNSSAGKDVMILSCDHPHVTEEALPLAKYVLDLCRQFLLLENDRTTFLSNKDHILAMELCLERFKQSTGEKDYKVHNEEIINCHNTYASSHLYSNAVEINEHLREPIQMYRDFLKHNNCTDLWELYTLLKEHMQGDANDLVEHLKKFHFLLLGVPESNIMKAVALLLSKNNKVHHIMIETSLNESLENCLDENTPLNEESSVKIISEISDLNNLPDGTTSKNFGSSTKEYVEDVISAFLTLLINCRNELALSKAMTCPIIDLSHSGFTDLKHVALEKKMPMCSTVISHVTMVKLGGKGYAPPEDCPLQKHIKLLTQFVDLHNQLQTIIEDDANTKNAVKRVINVLKNRLLKCNNNRLKSESIENVAEDLLTKALKFYEKIPTTQKKTSPQLGQKTIEVFLQLVDYLSCCCYSSDPYVILDSHNLHRTPINVPPLLGYFRSPEEDTSNDTSSCISEKSISATVVNSVAPFVPYVHNSNSASTTASCFNSSTPTKTSFKDCFESTENTTGKNLDTVEMSTKEKPTTDNKRKKRAGLSDVTNAKKVAKVVQPKSKKEKNNRKVKPQIKGQINITKFFVKV